MVILITSDCLKSNKADTETPSMTELKQNYNCTSGVLVWIFLLFKKGCRVLNAFEGTIIYYPHNREILEFVINPACGKPLGCLHKPSAVWHDIAYSLIGYWQRQSLLYTTKAAVRFRCVL